MIDIAPLSTPHKSSEDISFDTLAQYKTATLRLIRTVAPRFHPMLCAQILQSADALNHITIAIIMADWNWNGKGSKFGYRKQCVIWAIKGYMSRFKNNKIIRSLNEHSPGGDSKKELGDTIPQTRLLEPVKHTLKQEAITQLRIVLASTILTDIQRQCVKDKYFEQMTLRQIAAKVGISYQMVSNHINTALSKLRKALS